MSETCPTAKAEHASAVYSVLRQVMQFPAANYGLSPQQAWGWILQEAMAKMAGLVEVAQAIVNG